MLTLSLILVACMNILGWSAGRLIDSSIALARHYRMPHLFVGMIIVGFGTSIPELMVSSIASYEGSPGIALGNIFGSNIANIGLILGITALTVPVKIHSYAMRIELPILIAVSLITGYLILDGQLSRIDSGILLSIFAIYMIWTLSNAIHKRHKIAEDPPVVKTSVKMSLRTAVMWILIGTILLSVSSYILVWAAMEIAKGLGIDDLYLGLTIVAVGTSIPEFASSVVAAKKGEHDIALGNIIGSNLFNTLAVTGAAGMIGPMSVQSIIINRDITVMILFTLFLAAFGLHYGKKSSGITDYDGLILFGAFSLYIVYLGFAAFN